MGWRVRAIRGAITVEDNTEQAIASAVTELLDALLSRNSLDPDELINVIFSATPDLDAVFPAKVARAHPCWGHVPLLDVQQMLVPGSLPRCIRVLVQLNSCLPQTEMRHVYLRGARELRPDLERIPSR